MEKWQILMEWSCDPEAVVIPEGDEDRLIDWLRDQSIETWHRVVMTWNYDYGGKVLRWILEQERCDRGTAARVFLVEGIGHWLFDSPANSNLAKDETHLCRIVLRNWHRYRTSEFNHGYEISEETLKAVLSKREEDYLINTPLEEIMAYQGKRDAVSDYESSDGQIVVSMDVWMKSKGIEVS